MSHLIVSLRFVSRFTLLASALLLAGCFGGGGGDGGDQSAGGGGSSGGGGGGTVPPNSYVVEDQMTIEEAARFLNQATFGATEADIDQLVEAGYSQWFVSQLNQPINETVPGMLAREAAGDDLSRDDIAQVFWNSAIAGPDQLRQRVAFALSQITVVSYENDQIASRPLGFAAYIDILNRGAFGDYRTFLEEITYSPMMAIYLTYLRNQKANPSTGAVPDENYAREIMQLFSIGLVELNTDGSVRNDGSDNAIETYSTTDVTELAKVFTGLSWKGTGFWGDEAVDAEYSPLQMFDDRHSTEAKSFLGITIPEDTSGTESIRLALDRLASHENTAPFLSRQLIQRLVTSNPSADYISRVVNAFLTGEFTLPDGRSVGTGQEGDMAATIAAVLFDPEARDPDNMSAPEFGKIREPVIRFTHWARAFPVNSLDVEERWQVRNTNRADLLSQQAYRSPSVFNFYRPGYVAPGTETGTAQLFAPEMQITHESSVTGYMNFMRTFIDDTNQERSFVPNFAAELAVAEQPDALVERLNLVLTAGAMSAETRQRITDAVSSIEVSSSDPDQGRLRRVQAAVLLATTSADYIVQR